MGYTTDFEGVLTFSEGMTIDDLKVVQSICGEDPSDHPEWREFYPAVDGLHYIDLKVTKDLSGIEWDGSEKTYHLESAVSLIIAAVRQRNPSFTLAGELRAQGEEPRDRWILSVDENGVGQKNEIPDTGDWVECPDCGHEWELGKR